MSHPPLPKKKKKELNIKHQTQMMEDSFHHMFFLFLKKSIYVGATQNITFFKNILYPLVYQTCDKKQHAFET